MLRAATQLIDLFPHSSMDCLWSTMDTCEAHEARGGTRQGSHMLRAAPLLRGCTLPLTDCSPEKSTHASSDPSLASQSTHPPHMAPLGMTAAG